jgi:hypothetical protein
VGNTTIELAKSAKFLGVILDGKLNFNEHIKIITRKAIASLMQCRRAVGLTWSLNPKTCNWMYSTVISPLDLFLLTVLVFGLGLLAQISIAKNSGESKQWHFTS